MPGIAATARAEWLKQRELSVPNEDAAVRARWGEDAGDTDQSSLLVTEAAATTEAARQMTYLATARAGDIFQIEGRWLDLEGETVAIDYAGQLGVVGTAMVLVLRSRVNPNINVTEIEGEVLI